MSVYLKRGDNKNELNPKNQIENSAIWFRMYGHKLIITDKIESSNIHILKIETNEYGNFWQKFES